MYEKLTLLLLLLLIFGLNSFLSSKISNDEYVTRYDVVWNFPSKDASGVMPIGNGDIAAGVYAIENGDLYLLMSKNDAFTYSGDIFKTGRVKISITPNPFAQGREFKQVLDYQTGSVHILADDVDIRIWADANRPIYNVKVTSPNRELKVNVSHDLWRRIDHCGYNIMSFNGEDPYELIDEPIQDVVVEREKGVVSYYNVGENSVYESDLKYYGVLELKDQFEDPYKNNIFGNYIESLDLSRSGDVLVGEGDDIELRIHSLACQTDNVEEFMARLEDQAAKAPSYASAWSEHCGWWRDFWGRSWIVASDRGVADDKRELFSGDVVNGKRVEDDKVALVSQCYQNFRYIMACQSRGSIQAKFNGGLFTQQLLVSKEEVADQRFLRVGDIDSVERGVLTNPDDRLWGRRFTFQNQRLLYWPLLGFGDFENMQPFFNYYNDLLPHRLAVTKAWFEHDGAYFRENIEPTGMEKDNGGVDGKPSKAKEGTPSTFYHDYYFTCGLEIVAMMLEYSSYSGDGEFVKDVLTPFAREVLLFFDKHYRRDDSGKLRIDPSQVLETYWRAVNPAPDVAGLRYCLDGLLEMECGTEEDRDNWRRFKDEIPELVFKDGGRVIAPAQEYEKMYNSENGEIYPIFPFNSYGVALGSEDVVKETMRQRKHVDMFEHGCWSQDQIIWAYAGEAYEAMDGLKHRFSTASIQCRFPMYGKEWPDSCPDFDHFGSGSVALQRMLVQEGRDGEVLLFPAWSAQWDVNFKIYISNNSYVTGEVRDGRLIEWDIFPESRKANVIVGELQ